MNERLVCWFGLAVALCGLSNSAASQDYTFSTIAGLAGSAGGNDGTNSDARFHSPVGIAVDAAGNLYVGDLGNHTIRKLAPQGTNWIVTTIAGQAGVPGAADGTNTDATFDKPKGVAVDKDGNLFVADYYNHTIRKLAPQGTNWVVTTIAGLVATTGHSDGWGTNARFYGPTGITIDPTGRLFVTDTANFTIRMLEPVGTNYYVSTPAGTALNYGFLDGKNGQAEFNYPYGISVNSTGAVYIADWGNYSIRQMVQDQNNWVVTTIAGFSGQLGHTDGAGKIASFANPADVLVLTNHLLMVSDQYNDTVRELQPPGTDWLVSTVAGVAQVRGSADGTGTNALFRLPWGMAVDATGTLFICDYGNNTIRKGMRQVTLPSLLLQLSGSAAVLSWPASATNFVLESAATLATPAAWTPQTNGVVISSGSFVWTNPPGADQMFYRLRQL